MAPTAAASTTASSTSRRRSSSSTDKSSGSVQDSDVAAAQEAGWSEADLEVALAEHEEDLATERQQQQQLEQRALALAVPAGGARGAERACQQCGAMSVDNQLLTVFGEAVCRTCKKEHERFRLVTKSKAKEHFLVSDDDLASLKFLHASNPSKPGWAQMKLFMWQHVEMLALERWGSWPAIEAERQRRVAERVRGREKRARQASSTVDKSASKTALQRTIKRLRDETGNALDAAAGTAVGAANAAAAATAATAAVAAAAAAPSEPEMRLRMDQYHEHEFGEAVPIAGHQDWFLKKCRGCGLKLRFELL
jgi:DNA repair protein